MKAIVDQEACIGCGICPSVCPEVFEMGDDGKSHVILDDISGLEDSVEEAIENCPVAAISKEDVAEGTTDGSENTEVSEEGTTDGSENTEVSEEGTADDSQNIEVSEEDVAEETVDDSQNM